MSAISEPSRDQRQHPRIKVPAMYTLIRARVLGSNRYNWTGHIYDVSLGGVRFELDMPIEPGTQLEIRGMLPGAGHTTFRAIGRVVRVHSDASELGPAISVDLQRGQFAFARNACRRINALNVYASSRYEADARNNTNANPKPRLFKH